MIKMRYDERFQLSASDHRLLLLLMLLLSERQMSIEVDVISCNPFV
jgi:hypothetical protein